VALVLSTGANEMRHELTIRSTDRGLTDIQITVPRGYRREGLDLLVQAMPAIRELERRTRRAPRRHDLVPAVGAA
jgi:hypothetical protein